MDDEKAVGVLIKEKAKVCRKCESGDEKLQKGERKAINHCYYLDGEAYGIYKAILET